MKIARVKINNFRNFSSIDVALGEHAVIVGENKIGKSNFVYALRLVLDPSLPDSGRNLRDEDFWDGLKRPLTATNKISISVDLSDFEGDPNHLALLAEHLVEPEPLVARLTYIWQPIPDLKGSPTKAADYEFFVYGGDRPENRVSYEIRRRLPMELVPALRDCEGDLARWSRSPLRPLLDKAAGKVEQEKLDEVAQGMDKATKALTDLEEVSDVAHAITNKLNVMVGPAQSLETAMRFSPTDPDKLIRALRLFIDGGRRGIADASLGSANLIYFALKALEYDQLVSEGSRDHTFLAIEEPEAHLHPNLQRLIFRNYLRQRGQTTDGQSSATVLMTTHSPHIASVTPARDFVLLRSAADGKSTEATSTAEMDISDEDIADLERYLDVNRGEILFARGVILVEGDAERFLVPVLAKQQGINLDELGITVCSVSGTNFGPYLTLLGPSGLNLPVAALTDMDPLPPKSDGSARLSLGEIRAVRQMLVHLIDKSILDKNDFNKILTMGPDYGIFLNEDTLEVDLFFVDLEDAFTKSLNGLSASDAAKKRMKSWADDPSTFDKDQFLKDIESVGKGRFAQRLAGVILEDDLKECPDYILDAVKYVVDKTHRS